jgi:hypothetical protein
VSWDPFQRAVLAELGLPLYRLPGASSPLSTQASVPETAGDPGMLARLARAAGMAPDALLAHAEIAAAAARLHGDAAAKRALWPRLRALRKRAG